jgi:hypothetical protein
MDKVEVYVNYELPYNINANGWQLAYTKEYEEGTHVIYDMITIHKYTKQFYVEVWFKGLDFPYQVGFPCWKNEEEGSMFHINTRLDTWGELLGLPRRIYKEDIPEEEYYKTFPRYYPFDIEQDFWYYSRLVNEYAWNDLAINEVDLHADNNADVLGATYLKDALGKRTGDITNLETTDKSSIVAAINELDARAGELEDLNTED